MSDVSTTPATLEQHPGVEEARPPRPPRQGHWELTVHERLIAGDPQALSDVYDQYASFVHGLALKVSRDKRAAEECVQEVFLHLWQHPDRFDPTRGTLRAYIGTLTHRRAVDFVRREEARRKREDADARSALAPPDVGEMATSIVIAERVRAAVDALPEDMRIALTLAYFGGRTYRQVAEELEIPEGTAKSRLRAALKRVAEILEAEGVMP